MYAVKHVNRIDTQTPPKKNANQARTVEFFEASGLSRGERNSYEDEKQERLARVSLVVTSGDCCRTSRGLVTYLAHERKR